MANSTPIYLFGRASFYKTSDAKQGEWVHCCPDINTNILRNYASVRAIVARLALTCPPAWSQNESGLLQMPDAEAMIARPAAQGIDGVVLWGATVDCQSTQGGRTCNQKCDDQSTFLRSSLGPTAFQAVQRAAGCAAKSCPHGGRCITIDGHGQDLPSPKCTASRGPVGTGGH